MFVIQHKMNNKLTKETNNANKNLNSNDSNIVADSTNKFYILQTIETLELSSAKKAWEYMYMKKIWSLNINYRHTWTKSNCLTQLNEKQQNKSTNNGLQQNKNLMVGNKCNCEMQHLLQSLSCFGSFFGVF